MKILTWQARNNKKVTLVKLSKMTGISKSTLNNIENEKVYPTIAELEAIAKALRMKITDLFDSDYK
ncbi:MAG: helix-turn-helix transcriptional regulator [Roseburia inulinivorans]|nr:helix-turn-helix transcriptional regulator [Roseburia inulinivorans]